MYLKRQLNFLLLAAATTFNVYADTDLPPSARKSVAAPTANLTLSPQAAALIFDEDGTVRLMTRSGKILDFACNQEQAKSGSPTKVNCAAHPPLSQTGTPPVVKRSRGEDRANAFVPAMATAPAKQCMTFFYNAGGGELKAYEYCW